jgi:hypothetical protein
MHVGFLNRVKLQRNGCDFIFLDPDGMGRKDSIGQARFTGLTGFFSPSARSPFGRRPFYFDDPVNPVQFPINDENPILFLPYFDLRFFYVFSTIRLAALLRRVNFTGQRRCRTQTRFLVD